jgi:hypothetical protein
MTIFSPIRTEGPEALTNPERLSIYLGNVVMGVAGFAMGAPEVAMETLFLMHPNPAKSYSFNYGFAMKSPYIRKLVQDFASGVASGRTGMRLHRVPLRWTPRMPYVLYDYRVSLALAGGGLRAVAHKNGAGFRIDNSITIDIRYSEGYRLDIFNAYGVRFYIDEAIFSAMQDLGWFNPYVVRYHWSVQTDEYGNINT